MIHPIQNHGMSTPTPSVFKEGASSSESKITAFAIGVFVSLASFFLLPAEGALIISAGAAALLSFCTCMPSEPAAEGEQPRWYHPIIQAVPVFFGQNVVPVVNPGPRVPVGGQRYYQHVPIAPRAVGGFNHGPHAPVGVGHREVGVGAFNPEQGLAQRPLQQPMAHPAIHPHPANRNDAPADQGRVPVGHGHRRF